jgi:hypothetical protein
MVLDHVHQAKEQDHKGRHSTSPCPTHKDVQLLRVQRRYASLFFITGITQNDNELITLEVIHRYVEVRGGALIACKGLSRVLRTDSGSLFWECSFLHFVGDPG